MKRNIFLFLTMTLFASCESSAHLNPSDIIGTWQNTQLNVEVNSVNNTDSVGILNIAPGEWEKALSIQPIKTTYWMDGTFVSVYTGLDGKEIGKEEGKWSIRNDSLILLSNNYQNAYHVTTLNNRARFISLLDWDQDGVKDDLYDGWQIKVE